MCVACGMGAIEYCDEPENAVSVNRRMNSQRTHRDGSSVFSRKVNETEHARRVSEITVRLADSEKIHVIAVSIYEIALRNSQNT